MHWSRPVISFFLAIFLAAAAACTLNTSGTAATERPTEGSPILATLVSPEAPTAKPTVVTVTPSAQPLVVTITPSPTPPPGLPPVTIVGVDLPVVGSPGLESSGAAPCVVTNPGTTPLPLHTTPDDSSQTVALLQPGSGLSAFQYQSGWYDVNYSVGTQQFTGWVVETAVTPNGDCVSLKPPAVCSVQPSVGHIINIYAQPDRSSQIVSGLNERYNLPWISTNAQGWFHVAMGNAQSGWIAPDEGKLIGRC